MPEFDNNPKVSKPLKLPKFALDFKELAEKYPDKKFLKEISSFIIKNIENGNVLGNREAMHFLDKTCKDKSLVETRKQIIHLNPNRQLPSFKNQDFIIIGENANNGNSYNRVENAIIITKQKFIETFCGEGRDACYSTGPDTLFLNPPQDIKDLKLPQSIKDKESFYLDLIEHELLHKQGYTEFGAYFFLTEFKDKTTSRIMRIIEQYYDKAAQVASFIEKEQIENSKVDLSKVKRYALSIGATKKEIKKGFASYMQFKDHTIIAKENEIPNCEYNLTEKGLSQLENLMRKYESAPIAKGIDLGDARYNIKVSKMLYDNERKKANPDTKSYFLDQRENPLTMLKILKEATPSQLSALINSSDLIDALSYEITNIDISSISREEGTILLKRLNLAESLIKDKLKKEHFKKEVKYPFNVLLLKN